MFGGKGKGRKRNSKKPRTRSSGVCCVCVVLLFGVCVGSRPSRPASSNDKSCFRSCSLSFSSQSNRRRRMTTVGFASFFMHARRGRNGNGKVLHSIAYSIVSVKRPLLLSFLLVPHPRTHDGADRAPKTQGQKRKGGTRPPCPFLGPALPRTHALSLSLSRRSAPVSCSFFGCFHLIIVHFIPALSPSRSLALASLLASNDTQKDLKTKSSRGPAPNRASPLRT